MCQNPIDNISDLEDMDIKHIDMSYTNIRDIGSLYLHKNIKYIKLEGTSITSLEYLQNSISSIMLLYI